MVFVSNEVDKEAELAKLVGSIQNTMSDRAAVNPVFHEKLQVYRSTLLPVVHKNWDGYDDKKKAELSLLNNFYCKLQFNI